MIKKSLAQLDISMPWHCFNNAEMCILICRYTYNNYGLIPGQYPLLFSVAMMYPTGAYIGSPASQFAGGWQQGTDVVTWQFQNVTNSAELGYGNPVGPVNGYACSHGLLNSSDPIIAITVYSWPEAASAGPQFLFQYPNICEMTFTTKSGAFFRWESGL
jgi:hypothetical protein